MNLCSAKAASGAPCQAWAIHDTDPPLCPAHSGLLGAPRGNTNALKHGYYQKKLSSDEMQSQSQSQSHPNRNRVTPGP